ncbi:MAG: L-histidine N(alpha)-methyltransferase [Deltaproteobacteria bacterium]|nr:MAG: L-histidine N(alpha)-methyltransferase [Deltaproteobacteria bacterium]
MPGAYRVLTAAELEAVGAEPLRELAIDVLVGLSSRPKRLSSRWIYDDAGSRLFQQICDLEVYYPTRCEFEILEAQKDEILRRLGETPFNLVDLGAGDGRKTRVLVEHFLAAGARFRYVPIDISEGAMRELTALVQKEYPGCEVAGLVTDYFSGIAYLAHQAPARRNLVLFLGSNIGNFTRPEARALLLRLWNAARPGDLVLVGFDLKKDIDVLLDAYNDPQGVTARFNKNLLARINRELGGHFELDRFRHYATYDVFSGAMESYLVSLEAQRVAVDALRTTFDFAPFEPIHTEYSYKYLVSDADALAQATGFRIEARFFDAKGYFMDALWSVEKPPESTETPASRGEGSR